MQQKFTFSKNERLKSEKVIAALFRSGNSLMAYPLRVVWISRKIDAEKPPLPAVQVSISVPKRVFKTAVDRNRIKRQIREAWRLHKHLFYEKLAETDAQLAVMLIFVAKEKLPYAEIEKGVIKMIRKFSLPAPQNS